MIYSIQLFVKELIYSIDQSIIATYITSQRERNKSCWRQKMRVNINFLDTHGYSLF